LVTEGSIGAPGKAVLQRGERRSRIIWPNAPPASNFQVFDNLNIETLVKHNVCAVEAVILQGVALRIGDPVKVKPYSKVSAEHSILTEKVGIIEAFEQHNARIRVSVVGNETINESIRVRERLLLNLDEIEPMRTQVLQKWGEK
jgi:hypothetical protein